MRRKHMQVWQLKFSFREKSVFDRLVIAVNTKTTFTKARIEMVSHAFA
jgi:hypothetical protein